MLCAKKSANIMLAVFVKILLLLLLPNPFRGMGAWRKTTEPQKPGNSPGPAPEVVETESPKSEWCKESVAGQCRMKCVLERTATEKDS